MNRRILLLIIVAAALLTTATLLLTNCDRSGYKTFTLKRGIGHFWFEYPSSYDIARVEVRNDEEHIYTNVGLNAPYLKEIAGLTSISV
jgi:hypothetical protein